jgi:hypothetical protein
MGDDDAGRVRRSELIPSMTRALAAAVTTAEVAQATVSSLLTATEADEVAFAVVQDRGRRLRIIAATGTTLLGAPRSVVDLVTDPDHPVARAIRSGGIVVERPRSAASSVRAYAPVVAGDRVADVIAVALAGSTGADLSVLEGTADRVGGRWNASGCSGQSGRRVPRPTGRSRAWNGSKLPRRSWRRGSRSGR